MKLSQPKKIVASRKNCEREEWKRGLKYFKVRVLLHVPIVSGPSSPMGDLPRIQIEERFYCVVHRNQGEEQAQVCVRMHLGVEK